MNRFERIKQDKDGLDVLAALERAAEDGWESLDDGDLMRLKWYGLYAHNSGDGFFMLRVKATNGIVTGDQWDVLTELARDHARGVADCTTRQCFQFHWLTLDVMPAVLERLGAVGLTTSGACGDIMRNVVGCPLAGIAHEELADGWGVARAVHRRFLDDRAYSNLPRKYKVSITGCAEDCARGPINDVALSGALAADGTPGFNVLVGGGLASHPRFARNIDVFTPEDEAVDLIEGITGIFRDSDVLREKRGKARLKFLLDEWGPERFRAQLERRLGRELRTAVPLNRHAAEYRGGQDHIGVTSQRDGVRSAVGLCVPVGRIGADQMDAVGRLARAYGTGEVRLSHQQNILVPHVPDARLDALLAEPLVSGELRAEPPAFTRGLQTCTGKEFCGLAKIYTKSRAAELAAFLDAQVAPNGHGPLRLHFAGCSSSCAQHQIADIGIEGVLKRVDGEMVEAMDVRIGGRLGADPRFGEVVLKKVPHWELFETVLGILDVYTAEHDEGESFAAFAARTPAAWWQERLKRVPVEA